MPESLVYRRFPHRDSKAGHTRQDSAFVCAVPLDAGSWRDS